MPELAWLYKIADSQVMKVACLGACESASSNSIRYSEGGGISSSSSGNGSSLKYKIAA